MITFNDEELTKLHKWLEQEIAATKALIEQMEKISVRTDLYKLELAAYSVLLRKFDKTERQIV